MKNSEKPETGEAIGYFQDETGEYFSLTDILRDSPEPETIMQFWLREIPNLDFLAAWEKLENPGFKLDGFEKVRKAAMSNAFVAMPQDWVDWTGATGIKIRTEAACEKVYAHTDIALQFCCWLNPHFQLRLNRRFREMKAAYQLSQQLPKELAGQLPSPEELREELKRAVR